jgi:hypothetical protein
MTTNSSYVTITPDIVQVNEYTAFSNNFVVNFTPPLDYIGYSGTSTYNYVFYKIIPDVNIPSWNKITWTKTGDMTFSISGTFSDVFDKSLKYVNKDYTRGVATRFALLPKTYAAMYGYTPPTATQIAFNFQVVMIPSGVPVNAVVPSQYDIYNVTYMVQNNSQIANQYFVNAVQNGVWTKSYGNN